MGFICTICAPYCTGYSRITFIIIKFWKTLVFQGIKQQSSQNSCTVLIMQLEWKTSKCHCRSWMVSHKSKWGRETVKGYTGAQLWAMWIWCQLLLAFTVNTQITPIHSNLHISISLRSSMHPMHEKFSFQTRNVFSRKLFQSR